MSSQFIPDFLDLKRKAAARRLNAVKCHFTAVKMGNLPDNCKTQPRAARARIP